MTKGESAEERAAREKFIRWLQEAEAAAVELVAVGDLLFRDGSPRILHCGGDTGSTRA